MFSRFITLILNKNTIYQKDLNIVNQYIKNILSITKIPNDICQIIISSGKRIRTLLALDTYYKYHKSVPEYLYKIFALIELIHFSSLLHDDVIDKNNIRRQRSSVYNMYGSKKTILLGDYLTTQIFDEITKLYIEQNVTEKFIKAVSDISYGAYLEQCLLPTCKLSEYIKVVSLKTSSLFQLATTIGIHNLQSARDIAMYAECFGIVYQVQNDLDDYNADTFQMSEDYTQSNVTYPIVVLFQKYYKLFNEKKQENFLKIKKLIKSEGFRQRASSDLSCYLKCLTNTDIYIDS